MPVTEVVRGVQSSSTMRGLGAYGYRILHDTYLSNDYIHNNYKNNHLLSTIVLARLCGSAKPIKN